MDRIKAEKVLNELFDDYSQFDYEKATGIEKIILILQGLAEEIEALKNHSHTIM